MRNTTQAIEEIMIFDSYWGGGGHKKCMCYWGRKHLLAFSTSRFWHVLGGQCEGIQWRYLDCYGKTIGSNNKFLLGLSSKVMDCRYGASCHLVVSSTMLEWRRLVVFKRILVYCSWCFLTWCFYTVDIYFGTGVLQPPLVFAFPYASSTFLVCAAGFSRILSKSFASTFSSTPWLSAQLQSQSAQLWWSHSRYWFKVILLVNSIELLFLITDKMLWTSPIALQIHHWCMCASLPNRLHDLFYQWCFNCLSHNHFDGTTTTLGWIR